MPQTLETNLVIGPIDQLVAGQPISDLPLAVMLSLSHLILYYYLFSENPRSNVKMIKAITGSNLRRDSQKDGDEQAPTRTRLIAVSVYLTRIGRPGPVLSQNRASKGYFEF